MGKRKTKKIKPSKSSLALKNRHKLDKEFHCHFCQHDRSVSIKIDMKSAVGFLNCRICGVNFSTRITSLDEPIDVYTTWMDKCRETEKLMQLKDDNKQLKFEQKVQVEQVPVKTVTTEVKTKPTSEDLHDNTDNLNFDDTDDVDDLIQPFNLSEFKKSHPESGEFYRQPDEEENKHESTKDEDNLYDDVSENYLDEVSNKRTREDEYNDESDATEKSDTRVHDLFEDDD